MPSPVPEILDVEALDGIIVQEDFGDRQLRRVLESASEDERESYLEKAIQLSRNQLVEQIRSVNEPLSIGGIIMTMFDARTNLSQQVVNEVRQHFPNLVYQTIIPRSVRLGEAPSFGKPIIEYEPNGVGATAYRALAEEFVQRESGQIKFVNGTMAR